MSSQVSQIGLIGLAVMGQNLSLNIAQNGFRISVYNRSYQKTEDTIKRAHAEGAAAGWGNNLVGYKEIQEFVSSIAKPRAIIMLIQAGKPVDETIAQLKQHLEKGDIIIDGGNEWYANTERRGKEVEPLGLLYVGMGVSGGEEGARYGPSLMPGGPRAAYQRIEPILTKISAKSDSGPCVTYIGEGGSGNYVKMIHNGIEYGDMQLIAEAYDVLKTVGGLSNQELANTFASWNEGELKSFLIEITSLIFTKKDAENPSAYVVDTIVDKTGSKGTGKWTVQEAAELAVPAPTITAALDARYLASLRDQRLQAAKLFPTITSASSSSSSIDKAALINEVRAALYAAKICSYAQGMNLIKKAGEEHNWKLNLGEIARIWKGGCIIRAIFLDRITRAYQQEPNLPSLFFNPDFTKELQERQGAFRKVVGLAIAQGISVPAFSASLAYFDSYRRDRLPANLTQAQRDFFGAHTYERLDKPGIFHTEWSK